MELKEGTKLAQEDNATGEGESGSMAEQANSP